MSDVKNISKYKWTLKLEIVMFSVMCSVNSWSITNKIKYTPNIFYQLKHPLLL